MQTLVLLLVVTAASYLSSPPLQLNGACASVKQRETWKTASGQPCWSYRIKVQPWTVFGRVHVQLHGWDLALTKNFSCAVEQHAGRDLVAVLHPHSGFDDTFQLLGTGEPYADPDLSCEALQEHNATTADCPLTPHFHVESNWEALQSGRFRANVQLDLWVLQTIITLDFGSGTTVSVGRDLIGARLTDGGDGSSSTAVVSLLPLKHCLGMYKDASCDNSFGFSAVATPGIRALPRITCLLTRSMPTPPPPSPPNPPPTPPPGFLINTDLCYLGGTAHYVVAPHKVAAQAALQTWLVAIHLNTWLAGLRLVLDFPGAVHAEHGLHVHSVYPAEVARLVSVTRHSAIVELLPTAARDFRFEALGDVDEVRVTCDIGDARPPPPPPPEAPYLPPMDGETDGGWANAAGDPVHIDQATGAVGEIVGGFLPPPFISQPPPSPPPLPTESKPWGLLISVALMAFVGFHAMQAQRDPTTYMIMLAEYVRAARMHATKTPLGRKLLMKVTASSIGAQLMSVEARCLGLPYSSEVSSAERGLQVSAKKDAALAGTAAGERQTKGKARAKGIVQSRGDVKRAGSREDEQQEQQEPLVGQPHIYGFDACHHRTDLDVGDENAEIAPPRVSDSRHASASRAKVSSGKIQLILKSGGIVKRRDVDLRRVQNISDLQSLVADVCKSLDTRVNSSGLRMRYTDSRGQMHTVSRSTSMESIRAAWGLLLMPKDETDPEGRRSKLDAEME
jgi:hypothetical protein